MLEQPLETWDDGISYGDDLQKVDDGETAATLRI